MVSGFHTFHSAILRNVRSPSCSTKHYYYCYYIYNYYFVRDLLVDITVRRLISITNDTPYNYEYGVLSYENIYIYIYFYAVILFCPIGVVFAIELKKLFVVFSFHEAAVGQIVPR